MLGFFLPRQARPKATHVPYSHDLFAPVPEGRTTGQSLCVQED